MKPAYTYHTETVYSLHVFGEITLLISEPMSAFIQLIPHDFRIVHHWIYISCMAHEETNIHLLELFIT